jgi:hypothetical protein
MASQLKRIRVAGWIIAVVYVAGFGSLYEYLLHSYEIPFEGARFLIPSVHVLLTGITVIGVVYLHNKLVKNWTGNRWTKVVKALAILFAIIGIIYLGAFLGLQFLLGPLVGSLALSLVVFFLLGSAGLLLNRSFGWYASAFAILILIAINSDAATSERPEESVINETKRMVNDTNSIFLNEDIVSIVGESATLNVFSLILYLGLATVLVLPGVLTSLKMPIDLFIKPLDKVG